MADTLVVTGGGNMTTSSLSISAGSGAPAGYPAPPFILNIEPGTSNFELVLVTGGAGTVASPWTFPIGNRGADSTTARAHNAGVAIAHTLSAGDLTAAATHDAAGSQGSPVHNLPGAAWLTGAFVTLAETTTTGGQTTVSGGGWSGISGSYKNLFIVCQCRLAETTVYSDDLLIQFNGDSSASYSYLTDYSQLAPATPTTYATVGSGYSGTSAPIFRIMASQGGATANAGGGFAIIPNYSGSTLNKMFYSFSGGGDGTSSFMDTRFRVGVYNPATQAAITAISINAPAGGMNVGGFFGLYAFG